MSSGESLIVILLIVIASMLYQIARQLSYLTGKRLKWNLPKFHFDRPLPKKEKEKENLPN